jgi:hypothetical protein
MSRVTSSLVQGTLVETPMALTEGLRNIPRLYGEKTEKVGPIDGWKCGMKQAGVVRSICLPYTILPPPYLRLKVILFH